MHNTVSVCEDATAELSEMKFLYLRGSFISLLLSVSNDFLNQFDHVFELALYICEKRDPFPVM